MADLSLTVMMMNEHVISCEIAVGVRLAGYHVLSSLVLENKE
jgi:hypothetical protein